MDKKQMKGVFVNGILNENPTFRLVLGMCPTIAVTTSVTNALGMGAAVIFVLMCSNMLISLLRNFIPEKVRIPCYVVVIAMFVTVVQMVMKAFLPALDASLGIFIPLIVVNCIILARAEAFAAKNSVLPAMIDGIGMGVGFTCSLTIIAMVRELLGAGSLFGISVFGPDYPPALMFILAPGGFLVLGLLLALINKIVLQREKVRPKKKTEAVAEEGMK
ncbi:electron transport complex subunit RsxE [Christensenella timonensis]|uniref:electron transport complex subunit RsxE n=1 Tax=Christensenella timonensis TaxID=1816678 RepID=UPI0011C7B11E|nr:electron transport complex subunit E [Christensenella timonensis]